MRPARLMGLLVVTFALLAVSVQQSFASVVPMDLGDLVAAADSVVEVTVMGTGARAGKGSAGIERAGIVTDTRIRVGKVLKGARPANVVVVQPGGTLGSQRLEVTEIPGFVAGERCILFLNSNGGVVGGYQGKLAIEDGEVPALGLSLKEAEARITGLSDGTTPNEPPQLPGPPAALGADAAPSVAAGTVVPSEPLETGVAGASGTTLLDETFETTPTGWTLATSNGTGFGRTTYRAQAGTGSLYCAQTTIPAPGPMPAAMYATYTRTSPVSLAGCTVATFTCDVYSSMTAGSTNWFNIQFADDPAGPWFTPSTFVQGSTGGWVRRTVDLRSVTDYFGAGTKDFTGGDVYVRLTTYHTTGTADEGVYVDNVTVVADSAAMPAITAISPSGRNAGIGETVTITGTAFGATRGTGKVEFLHGQYQNGTKVAATVYDSWSDTQIVCQVPRYAESGPVVVTDNGGLASGGFGYSVGFSAGGPKATTYPVRYYVNENCVDITGEGAAIQAAFPTWSGAGSYFSLSYAGVTTATTNPPSSYNGVNEVYFASSGFTDSRILAWNYYWYSGGTILDTNIIFNDANTWAVGAVSGAYDIETIALHELGHTVGLDDQYGELTKVMGAGSSNATRRALSTAEVNGAVYIHGAADTTPPGIPVVSSGTHPSASAWYSSAAPSVSFSATDAGGVAGYSYVLDQSAGTTPDTASEGSATAKAYSGLADGVWYFHVRAVDAAGNWGAAAHRAIRIDTVAPLTTCPQAGVLASSPVLVQLDAADTHAGVVSIAYGIDASPTLIYAGAFSVASEGAHTVNYRATDAAGNVEVARSATITIDTTSPTTDASASASWVQTATVEISCDDPSASVVYRLDSGSWTPYAGPVQVTDEGTHVVGFHATDVAGNAEAVKETTVRVDRTPPAISSDAAASYIDSATISLSATDTLSGVGLLEYRLDGADWTTGSVVTVTALGDHAIEARARDVAGNTSAPATATFAIAGSVVRFQQTDSKLAFGGAWSTASSGIYSGGSLVLARGAGTGYNVAFSGTSVDLICLKGPNYGKMRVSVDGAATETVSLYSPTYAYQQTAYHKALPGGSHTLRVEWTGEKDAGATNDYINLDAVDIGGTLAQASAFTGSIARFEQTEPKISYGGSGWTTASGSYSGGNLRLGRGTGTGFQVDFSGTGIDWIALKGKGYGIARVSVDGTATELVDLYADPYQTQQAVVSRRGLAEGAHTLRVEWTGSRNASATGDYINLDATDIVGTLVQAPEYLTRHEQNDPMIAYNGSGWSTATALSYSAGSLRLGRGGGTEYTVKFFGTGIDWIALTGKGYGIAQVVLDGTTETVDLYAPTYVSQTKVWSKRDLSETTHTVRFVWTGSKNASATGDYLDIDAVDIKGALMQAPAYDAMTRYEQNDPKLLYSGSAWSTSTSGSYSGGSLKVGRGTDTSVTVKFSGTGVEWIALKGNGYGLAAVYLDGSQVATASLWSATYQSDQVVYSNRGLANTTHTLRIVWLGLKGDPSASSDYISLDAIDVKGTLLQAP